MNLTNADVAAVFLEMGELLQIAGGDQYRARAFRRTAQLLEGMREPLVEQLKRNALDRVPGIGPGSVERIKQILATGTCSDHQKLLARLPTGLRDVLHVRGMGPRHARLAFEHLGVHNIESLEIAARTGALVMVPGIGAKTLERIVAHLDDMKRAKPRRLRLDEALAYGKRIIEWMREEPACTLLEQTGSARRRKETVGDLDVLVGTRQPRAVVQRFVTFPDVKEITLAGDSRATVIFTNGVQCDLRVVAPDTFGAGLHYFTGNKQHNIQVRVRANNMKLQLSEHGVYERKLFGRGQGELNRRIARIIVAGRTEEELFRSVKLPFIPPELREGDGEVEAAAEGKLPILVDTGDLQGDLHVEPKDIVAASALLHAARAAGFAYVGVVRDAADIDDEFVRELRLVEKRAGIRTLLCGRVPIDDDGGVTVPEAVKSALDLVYGCVVKGRAMSREEQTARVARALGSGKLDVLTRPTARVLLEDGGIDVDIWAVLKAAAKAHVLVEVSGDPLHLELDARGCRTNRDVGATLSIASCATTPEELGPRMGYALAQARRGWMSKELVGNAHSLAELQQFLGTRAGSAGAGAGDGGDGAARGARLQTWVVEDDLGAELTSATLSEATVQRLEKFLVGEPDAALERALTRVAGNALQRAFELVAKARGA